MSDQTINVNMAKKAEKEKKEPVCVSKELLQRLLTANTSHYYPTLQRAQMPTKQMPTTNEQQAKISRTNNLLLLQQQPNPPAQHNPASTHQQVRLPRRQPTAQQIPIIPQQKVQHGQLPKENSNNINTPHVSQTFTLRPGTSSLVSNNASFHIAEIEDFGKHILQTCQSVDKYIYDALILKNTVLPNLEAENVVLRKEVDVLRQENEKLVEKNIALSSSASNAQAEINSSQGKISSLSKEFRNIHRQLTDLKRTHSGVKEELSTTREELERRVDDMEKCLLQVKTRDETIRELEGHHKKIKRRRLKGRKVNMKLIVEVKKVRQSNTTFQAEVQKLKQTIREREVEIDNLNAEMDTATDEANDKETNYTKLCDNLKEQVGKLEESLEQEINIRKNLEEKCPDLMCRSFEKSMESIFSFMNARKPMLEKRKREADSVYIAQACSSTKKSNTVVSNLHQKEKDEGFWLLKNNCQLPKEVMDACETNSNKEKGEQYSLEWDKGGEVLDEITFIQSEDETSIRSNGDGNQKQATCPKNVTISLPQWKQLKESTSNVMAAGRYKKDNVNTTQPQSKKASISVCNLNDLVMTFKVSNKTE